VAPQPPPLNQLPQLASMAEQPKMTDLGGVGLGLELHKQRKASGTYGS